ncbi:MAG: metal ABC transporter ATP-binding protein [Thermoplasmatota archaeon]
MIRARELCVHYGDFCALHHFDLDVAPGEYLGIVGPNGGGKTTLMRALLGLVPSAHGELVIEGRVAYVAQDAIHQDPHVPISALEFVSLGRLGRRFWQRPKADDHARVQEAMEEVGVWDLRHHRLSTLSGGQRQRVHLAQALCQDAKVLLLDEPTNGVDPHNRQLIHQLLRHLCRDHDLTVIMVTHDTETLADVADRLIVVDKTKKFDGTGADYRASMRQEALVPSDNPFGAHA